MQRLIAQSWGFLPILGLALIAAGAPGQEAPKGKHKVVTFDELRRSADVKKVDNFDFKKDDKFGFKGDKYDKKERTDELPLFLAGLNRLGKDGWEIVVEGERGVIVRKGAAGETWEYRSLKTPDSALNGNSSDNEVLELAIEGLAAQGWELCLGRLADYPSLIFKRVRRMPVSGPVGVPPPPIR